MKPSLAASLAFFMAVAASADAQWLKQPTPNIPRTAEGKPDLTAPPPRVRRNMTTRPGQTLAWDSEGRLSSVTEAANRTTYLYSVGRRGRRSKRSLSGSSRRRR